MLEKAWGSPRSRGTASNQERPLDLSSSSASIFPWLWWMSQDCSVPGKQSVYSWPWDGSYRGSQPSTDILFPVLFLRFIYLFIFEFHVRVCVCQHVCMCTTRVQYLRTSEEGIRTLELVLLLQMGVSLLCGCWESNSSTRATSAFNPESSLQQSPYPPAPTCFKYCYC